MRKFEDDVIISGIGQSEIARRLGRSSLGLTLDAISAALADAGLSGDEVGALFTYPGGGTSLGPGFSGPALLDVYDAMGLDVNLLMGNYEGPAQLGPILNASLAISSGLARHAVVYRTVTEGSARAAAATSTEPTPSLSQSSLSQSSLSQSSLSQSSLSQSNLSQSNQWITAFGDGPAPIRYALLARRHFHDFGTTREQLGQIALTARRHASLNPKAVFREPLTLSEYLNARMIADPLCLYDCDVYCDGSTALVLSHVDYAADAPRAPVHLEALGMAPPSRADYAQHVVLQPGLRAADQMWGRTDLGPADVDVAGLYDGFSILTLLWLEALRFCGRGESGAFVDGGARISLGGELPINTNGGQLSGGRLHGLGFVHEMCLQLRRQAGDRQVASASVAAVSVGALPYVGCMLLRRAGA